MRKFWRFFYCLEWFDTVDFNRLLCPNNKMYDDIVFDDRCLSFIYRVILIPLCSNCIWNRYCQNQRRILPNFLLFVWLYTVELNRQPCPNDKMYDDVVFTDRFWYPLTVFGYRVWIGLSRLRHAHIAYEIDTAKIIAAFCRIYYCLYDYIRLNSVDCRVQTTWSTMMKFSLIDSVIHWLCLKCF